MLGIRKRIPSCRHYAKKTAMLGTGHPAMPKIANHVSHRAMIPQLPTYFRNDRLFPSEDLIIGDDRDGYS